MRMSCQMTGLRAGVLALALVGLGASSGRADTLINYSTSGQVSTTTGVSGPGVISFIPVTSNQFNSPSAFSLGDFQMAALPSGVSTTYVNTPFSITFLANTVNGVEPNPNDTPFELTGTLNGTITGASQSSVVAKFDPIANPTFMTGEFLNTLSFTDNPLSLVPSTTNNGRASAQAYLTTETRVPEPTSIALFLTTLAGLGVRHRVRARRAA
jgi:hypothetical protein